MDINYENLLVEIKKTFPEIIFVFAYGSAAYPQKNYDYKKNPPLIDLIFVVKDYNDWHSKNLKKNPSHYSGLSPYLGSNFLTFMQNNFIPVHFNPFINLSEYKIKYGVANASDFISDLINWDNLILPGRMHKPIRILDKNQNIYAEKIKIGIKENLFSALSISLLLNFKPFIKSNDLFETITGISYLGDFRFSVGAEDKNKIKNIVDNQKEEFLKLYLPFIKKSFLKDEVIFNENEDIFQFNANKENKNKLINHIPSSIGHKLSGKNKNYKEMMKSIPILDLNKHIMDTLISINRNYSIRMILYHSLTTSPLKNFTYVLNKFKKRFK